VRHIELLAEVPDHVCRLLRIDTTSRVVMINQETVSHIFTQRSFRDAAMIVGLLARQELNPVICGRDHVYPRSFFIMELPFVGAHDWIKIILKRVAAATSASKHDEIWVVTAHLVGNSTLFQMLKSSRFVMHRTTRGR
jgi:hypothetical protein